MPKKLFLVLCSSLFWIGNAFGQISFTEDFESYNTNSSLCLQSSSWTTWSGTPGGADDININTTNAHSGSNALYFTSTSTNGGPSDIILNFGGQHSIGDFSLTMWLNVASGKMGYFNLQGTSVPGTKWHSNFFFTSNGTLNITDDETTVFLGNYTQGQWFELKVNANLNTNDWEVFVNGTSQGHYQTNSYQIASMDLFATDNTNSFWVDDVDFTYTPFTLPNRNGAVSVIDIESGLATQTRTPGITVRNLGTTAITDFDITLTANGTPYNQNISSVNILSGSDYRFDMSTPITLATGLNTFTATISNVNGTASDDHAGDDSKTLSFSTVTPASDKVVVAEEFTGTWCQWCPRGTVFMEKMGEKYEDFIAPIAVHNGDPMVVSVYDQGISTLVSGAPSVVVDRGADIDPSDMENDFLNRVQVAPMGKLTNGAQLNSGTLDVSVTTEFLQNTSGNYKLICVLTEDSVTGNTSQYSQSNAYAGGNNGAMGGFENLPNPVPYSQMKYDYVARAIAPDFQGIPNAFTSPMSVGYTKTHYFQFNISNWNQNKLHIISMLVAPDGSINNAGITNIDESIANGYPLGVNEMTYLVSPLSVYPNPARDKVFISLQTREKMNANIEILDMQGRIISQKNRQLSDGSNIIPVEIYNIPNGLYVVKVNMKDGEVSKTFIKE